MTYFSDISTASWVDRLLPKWARPYARLLRLDRPIGIWLLLWPCLWSLALAAPQGPDIGLILLFTFGAIIMRGAGCVINDLYDLDLDRKVGRTAIRPLPSGQLTPRQALALLVILLLLGLGILLHFNSLTILLGFCSMPLILIYPLAKRITWWPQLVLGFTFNWGALMGWAAVHGELHVSAFLLYAAGVFWTLGYDTIYAHQDKADDARVGIKSLALYLADRSRGWIAGFYMAFFFLMILAGWTASMGPWFYIALLAAEIHAVWQIKGWDMDDPANCLKRFQSNRDFGFLVFTAILLGRFT